MKDNKETVKGSIKNMLHSSLLDSERDKKCIDFTMMFFSFYLLFLSWCFGTSYLLITSIPSKVLVDFLSN